MTIKIQNHNNKNSENLNFEFIEKPKQQSLSDLPLAARMRPDTLEEYVGQKHILGEGKLLNRAIKTDKLTSLIIFGPPGTGKTSLAYCISQITKTEFISINAVTSNVGELRQVIEQAKIRKINSGRKTILFIDEIHRFNKAQQDVLMPDVENQAIILIGATVHNPFFSLISPLISRSLVFELKPLSQEEISIIIDNALKDKIRGLGSFNVRIDNKAKNFLSKICDGDARRALGALELGVVSSKPDREGFINYDLSVAEESIQKKAVLYDKSEDGHYDTISAFIKSMRGSDPDAALYWLAKMIYAGEDIRFIARRICICASEDVGNADPQALILANAAMQVAEFVGLPEARIPLAQAAVYVACSPKSNASYLGIDKALKDIENDTTERIPNHLKNATFEGEKKLGRHVGYKYSHDFENGYVVQEYLPNKVKYYQPKAIGYEEKIKQYLEKLKK
ncbi:MAG: replication-associated recombination protein A [Candidatus Omnitrophota bacterium]